MNYLRRVISYLLARPPLAIAAAATVLVVAVSVTVVVASGSSQHSEQSFCEELRAGTEHMRQNMREGSNSSSGQLVAVLANLSEFNRVLHRLDDRAPEEIQSDMDAVVKMWDQQQDHLAEAASNPLGMLAAGLTSSILNATSVNAVDTYAAQHCHMALFGSVSVAGTGASRNGSPGGWSCGSTPPALTSSTTQELIAWLDGMKAAPAALTTAITALRSQVSAINPPPATTLEALGRLRLSHVDTQALLTNLNTAYTSVCGSAAVSDADLATLRDSNYPIPVDGGFNPGSGSLFGQCGTVVGYDAPPLVAYDCGDGTIATLDIATGTVTRGTGFSTNSGQHVRLAGNKLVYANNDVSPAQGLNPATWKEMLHVRDLDGRGGTDLELAHGTDDPPSTDPVAGAWPNRVAISIGTELRLYDTAGARLWSTPVDGPGNGDASRLTPGLLLYNGTLLDFDKGRKLLGSFASDVATDHCGLAAAETNGGSDVSWVSNGGAVHHLAIDQMTSSGRFTVGGGLVLHDNGSDLEGLTVAGRRVWSVPNKNANPLAYIGRWVVMQNQSRSAVLVDAATGADMTAARPDVANVLFRVANNFEVVAWNDEELLVKGSDVGNGQPSVLRLQRKDACG